jgi:[ribosomal protein S5]-alanine N-acetyltransferase
MTRIQPIHTQRLVLREHCDQDLPALLTLFSDSVFKQYEGQPFTEEQARNRLERDIASSLEEPRLQYRLAITLPPSEEMIGVVSVRVTFAEVHEWEMGWGVHPRLWGQGIATEAARAVLRFAFETLDANRVVAFCHAGNRASWRVMEKLGMRREAHLRETRWLNGQKFDEYLYAILRSD